MTLTTDKMHHIRGYFALIGPEPPASEPEDSRHAIERESELLWKMVQNGYRTTDDPSNRNESDPFDI